MHSISLFISGVSPGYSGLQDNGEKYLKVQSSDNQFTTDKIYTEVLISAFLKELSQILILFLTWRVFARQNPKEPSTLKTFLKAQFSHEVHLRKLPVWEAASPTGPDL